MKVKIFILNNSSSICTSSEFDTANLPEQIRNQVIKAVSIKELTLHENEKRIGMDSSLVIKEINSNGYHVAKHCINFNESVSSV